MWGELSFWRLGEEGRLKHVWRPVARSLNAIALMHAKKATRAVIITPEARYTYALSLVSALGDMTRRLRSLDIFEAMSLATAPGRPTLVTISVIPSFLEQHETITLKNPLVEIRGYNDQTCILAPAPGTVGAIRQTCLTPHRINDLRLMIRA